VAADTPVQFPKFTRERDTLGPECLILNSPLLVGSLQVASGFPIIAGAVVTEIASNTGLAKTGDRSVASQRLGDIRAREERLTLFTRDIETEEGSRGFGKEQQIRRDDECLGRYGYA